MNEALSREEELFDAARQISDPAQRRIFLRQAGDGDDALCARVEQLLAATIDAEQLFHQTLGAVRTGAGERLLAAAPIIAENLDTPGECLGAYRIASKMGEGGCGEVYLAEQQEPVRRRVALKIIKLGMDTRAVIARFNAERQALAMMDHPNISKVFDSGATASGRPYFVMELVSGIKITEFCDKAQLDMTARLRLFVEVCHAIQHAHQKGVIHRDIKPSNILVAWQDGRPTPKVIDFGIAKATETRLTDHTMVTAHAQLLGTPAYMSPEQADVGRLDIDTRSDVYSLGALLYELLTGRTPLDPKKLLASGADELRRQLREEEPPRPSAKLLSLQPGELAAAAQQRRIEPHKLIGLLRGELDWIAMKALEKDRDRRYQTANGLAMDVQRCLNNEPIVARPPSRLYQFGKMARRNRALFSAVTAVALTLVAALGASMWLLRQEIRARDRAVAAEKVEAQLRREAEARAKVAQALILINGERMSDADNLVDGLEWTAPSTDASSVLRALGDWRALSGQWKRAAPRLEALTFVNESEGWDLASLDFLECGACLAEMGDVAGYERFHRICADRFNGTTNLVLAERMLKINLLLPTAPPDSRALRTWAETAAQPVTGTENVEFRAAWRCVSLALYEYRMGHPTEAVARCKECLASPEFNAPRVATAEVIMALALHRLGSDEEARAHLQVGRQMIEAKFAAELGPGSATQGFWFDWIFGRVLLREALPQIL